MSNEFEYEKPTDESESVKKMLEEVEKEVKNKNDKKSQSLDIFNNKGCGYGNLRLIHYDVSIIDFNTLRFVFKFNDNTELDFHVSIKLAIGLVNTVFKRNKEINEK